MIPVNEPFIGEQEKRYVNECLDTAWISSAGRFIPEFEERFAAYCGRKTGIAVNNGSNALMAAMRALSFPQMSEVIMPSFTIISCALACLYNLVAPVFVDSDPETLTMKAEDIEKKITPMTRAVMVVHIYGHPVDMDPVMELARRHKLKVIEDFAEAIGSEYKGKRCGGFGDISVASFYGNKTVTTGEGGMCLTDDPALAERLKSIRNLCFVPDPRFVHHDLGWNLRITNVQAAIGLGQVERIDQSVEKKIETGKTYNRLLKKLQDKKKIRLPVEKSWAKNTYWMYGVLLEETLGVKAREIQKKMGEKGIQTRPFFFPLHQQPVFKTMPWFSEVSLPVSEKLYDYGFYLPSGITLTTAQIEEVAAALEETLNGI